jgi:hypothetical protein
MTEAIGQNLEPGTAAGEGRIPLCVPEVRGREWEYIKEAWIPIGCVAQSRLRNRRETCAELFREPRICLVEPSVLSYVPRGQPFDMRDLITLLLGDNKHIIAFPIGWTSCK